MKQNNKVRNNHYVPEWYQKLFSISIDKKICLLDMNPETTSLNRSKNTSKCRLFKQTYPKRCFYQTDLYTTFFDNEPCDEIEKYFFGKIDNDGSIGIKALANNDPSKIYSSFESCLKYIDIQKTRTPKGLDWLAARFPHIKNDELLIEMQINQQLNCSLWAESVKEIVSAENANIKFIFSDHPVTVYNKECPHDSYDCTYPNDPRIEMIGTQTIFPLNYNLCLIMTHIDYAKGEITSNAKEYRTNHTPFRNTISRLDNIIRKRSLNDSEVCAINFIIKSRAKRYVAAGKDLWLYPEKSINGDWMQLGEHLLPPKKELYKYGGEIFLGYEDGTTDYYDQYGRRRPIPQFLIKEPTNDSTGDNDYCPCGSGRIYSRCCKGKFLDERPNSTQLSIRERNLVFANRMLDILNFDTNGDWDECRKKLTNQMISEIYKAHSEIWPTETDIMDFFPRPDKKIFRSLYRGILHPYDIIPSVACLMFCFDDILIQNPFIHNDTLRKDYCPVDHPELHRLNAIRSILTYISLLPFIKECCVTVFPNPLDFSYSMRNQIMREAEILKSTFKFDDKSFSKFEAMTKAELKRAFITSYKSKLKDLISKSDNSLCEDEISSIYNEMMNHYANDLLFDLNPNDEVGQGQLLVNQIAPDLITSLFIAQATGSAISTSDPSIYNQIDHVISLSQCKSHVQNQLKNINLSFPFCDNISELANLTKQQDFKYAKNLLKNLWSIACKNKKVGKLTRIMPNDAVDKSTTSAANYLKNNTVHCQQKKIIKTTLSCNISFDGHQNNAVYRLLMAYAGHEKYLRHSPLLILLDIPIHDK